MDVTPLIPADRQVIQAYGDGGFSISGQRWAGSVLVFPKHTVEWPIASFAAMSLESLAAVVAAADDVDLLLVGCGERLGLVPSVVRQAVRAHGIVMEAMDTGAACRTYNVLLSEGRRIAAALVAI